MKQRTETETTTNELYTLACSISSKSKRASLRRTMTPIVIIATSEFISLKRVKHMLCFIVQKSNTAHFRRPNIKKQVTPTSGNEKRAILHPCLSSLWMVNLGGASSGKRQHRSGDVTPCLSSEKSRRGASSIKLRLHPPSPSTKKNLNQNSHTHTDIEGER